MSPADFSDAELSALPPELQIALLRVEVRQCSQATKDLVDAFNAAKTMLTFIKWLSSIAVALGILWAVLTKNIWPTA